MFFRGDGKSHIENGDCFDHANKESVCGKFTRAFLNPPYSQASEPERDFIDASMEALEPGGVMAAVVKAGIFADDDNAQWRTAFAKRHSVLAMISFPEDLFYPTAAPASIFIAKAHIPMQNNTEVFMARIQNDGFTKLKGKRVAVEGSQIPEIVQCYNDFLQGKHVSSSIAATTASANLLTGREFSPQQWLDHTQISYSESKTAMLAVQMSIFQTVVAIPEIAGEVVDGFPVDIKRLPDMPYGESGQLENFFYIFNGRSSGEKNYSDGDCPYISSGDAMNSVIRMVSGDEREVFSMGGITVTAFGQAYVQPWRFMARGNGGSSVRVLIPKFRMTYNEFLWFAAQINAQKWRFFYGRMAIKSRICKLIVVAPPIKMAQGDRSIRQKIASLCDTLESLNDL